MSFRDIQNTQKEQIEKHILKLLNLLNQTENKFNLAQLPTERENYQMEIVQIKSNIENYKQELKDLEDEIKETSKPSMSGQTPFLRNYRVSLDYSLPEEEINVNFHEEVDDILDLMGYEIEDVHISGATPTTFFAVQEGDFEPVKALFQCVYGIVDETTVRNFNGIYQSNRERLGLTLGRIVTNTYLAPTARALANGHNIGLITYEDLLDKVMNVTRYLRAKCKDYEENNKLFHTYVEIKYLRKGKGKFKDNQATSQEFLVTESSDGSSFEAKGELTPYVDNWLFIEGNSQICLLGDYGTGKTSFANHYFYKQASAYLKNPLKNRIPLLITLTRYHKSADIEQMITDFLVNECGIRRTANFNTFMKLAARGKLLFILDGFDEMAKHVDANVRKHNFKEISRLLVGNNSVILSGRPNYFLTQEEINEILDQESVDTDPYETARQKATIENKPKYGILNIALFDRWQIQEFLQKQSKYLKGQGIEDWRELEKTIYDTYNLEELARTPVLLEIIIKTISEIRGKVKDINAAKLYEIYTDFWLNRDYEKGEVRWLINRADKELFVSELAWQMLMADNLNPEIHFSQLSEHVQTHFGLKQATEIEYFSSDIRYCSYLIHSEADGNYKFIHKSLMEYFSARYIYKTLFEEHNLSKIVTDKPITDEVFFFFISNG